MKITIGSLLLLSCAATTLGNPVNHDTGVTGDTAADGHLRATNDGEVVAQDTCPPPWDNIICGLLEWSISAVKRAAKTGKARIADLACVVELVAGRRPILRDAGAVKPAWVKAHVGIEGNEKADEKVKDGARMRKEERERAGFGRGKFVTWCRTALTNYTWLWTRKGGVMCRRKISGEEARCTCGEAWSAEHVVFEYGELERPKSKKENGELVTWQFWEDLEGDRVEVGGVEGNPVEVWFTSLDLG
ncbi:hypothetical protein BDZ91DRAFT_798617 [Kalaharituber pfeilii]|nr:hypothetical protein BDZ91DRAFT_798617 [Kalaharituber pfeilii]